MTKIIKKAKINKIIQSKIDLKQYNKRMLIPGLFISQETGENIEIPGIQGTPGRNKNTLF